jgi:hypothetical protein
MPLEQVAEFEVFAEHVEILVAAEALELGGVRAGLHAGAEGAALEAVAAELAPRGTRRESPFGGRAGGLRRARVP